MHALFLPAYRKLGEDLASLPAKQVGIEQVLLNACMIGDQIRFPLFSTFCQFEL